MKRNNIQPLLNKIYQADCMDIMKNLPDKCIDLAIVDPPYGKNITKATLWRTTLKGGNWDNCIPDGQYFDNTLRNYFVFQKIK